jgi:hypothetical protein
LSFELLTGLAEYEDLQATEVIDDILGLAQRTHTNGAAEQPQGADAGSL